MLDKVFMRNFEQKDTRLPFPVQRVVRSIANSFLQHTTDSFAERQRQIEFAHVTLHMRLYQRLGTKSNQTIDSAHAYLDQLLSGRTIPATPTKQLRPAV